MYIIKLISALVFASSCRHQIKFINNSDKLIDSMSISVSSADLYDIKFGAIKAGDSVSVNIPYNVPKSNGHDITVCPTVFIKGLQAISAYNYTDLGGTLSNNYRITLGKDLNFTWKCE